MPSCTFEPCAQCKTASCQADHIQVLNITVHVSSNCPGGGKGRGGRGGGGHSSPNLCTTCTHIRACRLVCKCLGVQLAHEFYLSYPMASTINIYIRKKKCNLLLLFINLKVTNIQMIRTNGKYEECDHMEYKNKTLRAEH